MYDFIVNRLNEIEQAENIKIIHAVESGSRAWGFASPDSDFDVRFFYIRSKEHYLRLDKKRDVLEYPINGELDINGWDFDKTLKLLYASNPTLFEWCNSPIIYQSTDFFKDFLMITKDYFVLKSGLWHYFSMAECNYRGYLKGDLVKAKKYLYVLRPLLACRWILDQKTPPPMAFSELVETSLIPEIRQDINNLLKIKMTSPEVRVIPRIKSLNEFIENEMCSLRILIEAMPNTPQKDWGPLNDLFLIALQQSCKWCSLNDII